MGGCTMTTLAPDRVGPLAGPQAARRVPEPAAGPGRNAGGPQGDSGARAWLRRKAVAGWMNVLIAGTVAVTVVTAGMMAGPRLSRPGALGGSALQLFPLWWPALPPG